MNSRKLTIAFALLGSGVGGAFADDPAEVVRSAGIARYEKNTNYLLFVSGHQYPAEIPLQAEVGQRILIKYVIDAKTQVDTFDVKAILIRGDLCWLSNTADPSKREVGDIVYIKPCVKLR